MKNVRKWLFNNVLGILAFIYQRKNSFTSSYTYKNDILIKQRYNNMLIFLKLGIYFYTFGMKGIKERKLKHYELIDI